MVKTWYFNIIRVRSNKILNVIENYFKSIKTKKQEI